MFTLIDTIIITLKRRAITKWKAKLAAAASGMEEFKVADFERYLEHKTKHVVAQLRLNDLKLELDLLTGERYWDVQLVRKEPKCAKETPESYDYEVWLYCLRTVAQYNKVNDIDSYIGSATIEAFDAGVGAQAWFDTIVKPNLRRNNGAPALDVREERQLLSITEPFVIEGDKYGVCQ